VEVEREARVVLLDDDTSGLLDGLSADPHICLVNLAVIKKMVIGGWVVGGCKSIILESFESIIHQQGGWKPEQQHGRKE
jgi:hypothetical protein